VAEAAVAEDGGESWLPSPHPAVMAVHHTQVMVQIGGVGAAVVMMSFNYRRVSRGVTGTDNGWWYGGDSEVTGRAIKAGGVGGEAEDDG
jgi:hypothetical protein